MTRFEELDLSPCPYHGEYKEGCAECIADHDALMGHIEAQTREAEVIVERLAKEGVAFPEHLMTASRVEALVEALLVTRRARMAYEYAAGEKVLGHLKEGQRALSKHTDLLIPQQPRNGLHIAKRH